MPEVINCSFCGKSSDDVRKMIARKDVFSQAPPAICDECVLRCMEMMAAAQELDWDERAIWRERVESFQQLLPSPLRLV